MRYTTKTEYGLMCLIYMASNSELHPITIKEIVSDEHYSQTFTEKILQKLRAGKIVSSHQGSQGGYVLARPAAEITLREVIDALEGQTFEVFCEHVQRCCDSFQYRQQCRDPAYNDGLSRKKGRRLEPYSRFCAAFGRDGEYGWHRVV